MQWFRAKDVDEMISSGKIMTPKRCLDFLRGKANSRRK